MDAVQSLEKLVSKTATILIVACILFWFTSMICLLWKS